MLINCVLKASSRFIYEDQTYKKGDPMVIPQSVFDQFPSLFQKIEDVPEEGDLVTAQQVLDSDDYQAMRAYVADHGIDTPDSRKETLRAAIEAVLDA